jgi:hypothetical protein
LIAGHSFASLDDNKRALDAFAERYIQPSR